MSNDRDKERTYWVGTSVPALRCFYTVLIKQLISWKNIVFQLIGYKSIA